MNNTLNNNSNKNIIQSPYINQTSSSNKKLKYYSQKKKDK